MARDNLNLLCPQVPVEILTETAYDEDGQPDLLRDFLVAGFSHWPAQKHGRNVGPSSLSE